MNQAVLTGPMEFSLRQAPRPVITENQALLEVKSVGICGSDIHASTGEHPFMTFPIVLGHEATGVVVEAGSKVRSVKKGDRVVMRPQQICGECAPCREGRYNICENLKVLGCQVDGACADYYPVEENLLYKLPESVGFDEGTLIEPLAVAVHAVRRAGQNLSDKNVVVMGAGTIGNLVAQSAKAMGARKVIICDISSFKLDIARKCGIENGINNKNTDLKKGFNDILGDERITEAFECTASEAALESLINLSPKGIPIIIVGVYGHPVQVNMGLVQDREFSLIGTLMYTEEDYIESLRLVEEGRISLAPLITARFPLGDIENAFRSVHSNREISQKVVLTVSPGGEEGV